MPQKPFEHNPVKPVTSSWWTCAPEQFYNLAHERFPLAGTPIVDRAKEFTGATMGPTFKARASVRRRTGADRG